MEAREENVASNEEWEAEYQEAVVLVTSVKQYRSGEPQSFGRPKAKLDKFTQKLLSAKCRQLRYWKDHRSCLVKVKSVNWTDGSSKLAGELGTVSGVSRAWQFSELETRV